MLDYSKRTKAVPFDLEQPIRMREWRTSAAERQWLEKLGVALKPV